MCLFGSNIHVLPSQFCFFFKKCFFSLFFFGKIVRDRLQIFGARETGTRKQEREKGKGPSSSLTRPILFLLLLFFPDTSNIRPSQTFCAHVAGSHIQFFFPFWLVAKIHDQHSGPPFPFKIRRRISWERKKEGKGKYVAFSLNSNKIQLFPLLFLEKKLFLKIFILTNSAREEFKNKT